MFGSLALESLVKHYNECGMEFSERRKDYLNTVMQELENKVIEEPDQKPEETPDVEMADEPQEARMPDS